LDFSVTCDASHVCVLSADLADAVQLCVQAVWFVGGAIVGFTVVMAAGLLFRRVG
jgi:hypothetical protein